MNTRAHAGEDRHRTDAFLDRLAVLVSSEEFVLAFVWWNVLLALAPACAVCALHLHATGALHVALSVGIAGAVVAAVAVVRLVAIAGSLRGALPAA